ncbi:PIN domain-containing protein [Nocardia araoensis]|uniref:PIN domain-containing protein n=1 Tax=Nocardia araoensis TaxID=228600 RepID=UPI0012F6B3FF|nr:PIN domain-containing protein [Nocardia araoensis]
MARRRHEGTPLVYLDACVFLDLIVKNENDLHRDTGEVRWKSARLVLDAVEAGKIRLAASALLEAEVLANGATRRRLRTSEKVVAGLRAWFTSPETRWTDVDRFLASDAAKIAASCEGMSADAGMSLRGADAVHVAAAVRLKADYLMTHDGGYPIGHKVEDTQIIRPTRVWNPDLFE